jgi:uncharacterized membrane protein
MPSTPVGFVSVATVLGAIACGIGLFIVFSNYAIIRANRRNREQGIDRHISFVPLAGPILAFVGLLPLQRLLGVPTWTTLVVWALDPGTWVVAVGVVYLPWTEWRESRERTRRD